MGDHQEQQVHSLFSELTDYEKRRDSYIAEWSARKPYASRAGAYYAGRLSVYARLCVE